MSKENVEEFLIKGGSDKHWRAQFNEIEDKQTFCDKAKEEGFDFTVDELDLVLKESGDSFESVGNPRKKQIWWS